MTFRDMYAPRTQQMIISFYNDKLESIIV